MKFKTKATNSLDKKIGCVFMYLVFTTILYFILKLLNKLPGSWNYLHVLILTLFIVLLGTLIKLLLR